MAEKFWDDVDNTQQTLKDLLDTASSTEPPALDSAAQQAQQEHIEVGMQAVGV
jgi:DNA-binding FadR family transcriptional regulator